MATTTTKQVSIHDRLLAIQQGLHAPKNLNNDFGHFAYRNASGILEALKPLLKEQGCTLLMSDTMVEVGNRVYLRTDVTLADANGFTITTSGWAREQEHKGGMDDAQLTGACSSYARKYALCGMFAIDDSKDDPDAKDNRNEGKTPDPAPLDRETYYKYVQMQAFGKKGRDGKTTAREAYIKTYNPTQEDIDAFDNAVQEVRLANKLI